MELIVEIVTLIVCVLLIMIVLVQDSKGGGLSSTFGASNQILGVRKTTDFLEKATWVMAISLLVLCLVSTSFLHSSTAGNTETSVTQQRAQDINVPQPTQQQRPAQQPQQPQQPQQGQQPANGTGAPAAPAQNPK